MDLQAKRNAFIEIVSDHSEYWQLKIAMTCCHITILGKVREVAHAVSGRDDIRNCKSDPEMPFVLVAWPYHHLDSTQNPQRCQSFV
jgi:hypothetical protein